MHIRIAILQPINWNQLSCFVAWGCKHSARPSFRPLQFVPLAKQAGALKEFSCFSTQHIHVCLSKQKSNDRIIYIYIFYKKHVLLFYGMLLNFCWRKSTSLCNRFMVISWSYKCLFALHYSCVLCSIYAGHSFRPVTPTLESEHDW